MGLEEIMFDDNVQITGLVLGIVFVTGNLAEFIYDAVQRKNYYTHQSLLVNFSIALLQQLTDVFNKVIFFAGFYFVQQHYSVQNLLGWPAIKIDFPVVITASFPFINISFYMLFVWLFILVIADFCQYWLHRLSHEVNILWAGHIVHHSMEAYNYSVALRQSFIESIYTWIFYLPLAFFGIPWQLFIMAYAVSLIWQFFVHTRFVGKLGVLENILATPSHHRVHHGKNPQYIDKNYGALFILWDKLFGTFEPEVEPVDYGVTVPLQTQNPLWVNVHHHMHIFKSSYYTNGISNKLRVIFGRPAFISDKKKGEHLIPANLSSPELQKLTVLKQSYVFVNFLFTALSGFLLINYYRETKDVLFFIPPAIIIAASFSINIALLENRKWADYAEVLKLLMILGFGIAFAIHSSVLLPGMLIVSVALGMLLYTGFIARNYKQSVRMSAVKI